MKLTIKNKNGIVDSAFFKTNGFCISLIINTTGRWRSYDAQGGGTDESGAREEEFIFEKDPDGNNDDYDSVSLTSENDVEKKSLGKLQFENHNKEQIHIIFLHESILGGSFSKK